MAQASDFRGLANRAKNASPENDEEFVSILCEAIKLLEITYQQFADTHLMSRTSVGHWVSGKNLPVRAMRGLIFKWIKKESERQAKILDPQDED